MLHSSSFLHEPESFGLYVLLYRYLGVVNDDSEFLVNKCYVRKIYLTIAVAASRDQSGATMRPDRTIIVLFL